MLPSLVTVLLVVTSLFGTLPSPNTPVATAADQKAEKQRDVTVVLKKGTDPREGARGTRANPTHLYDHVIDGFCRDVAAAGDPRAGAPPGCDRRRPGPSG